MGGAQQKVVLLCACSDVSCLHTLPLPLLSMHPPMQDMHSVPLGIAAEKGHVQVVERLLRERVNINYQNKVRSTLYNKYALHCTIHNMSLQDSLVVGNICLSPTVNISPSTVYMARVW